MYIYIIVYMDILYVYIHKYYIYIIFYTHIYHPCHNQRPKKKIVPDRGCRATTLESCWWIWVRLLELSLGSLGMDAENGFLIMDSQYLKSMNTLQCPCFLVLPYGSSCTFLGSGTGV